MYKSLFACDLAMGDRHDTAVILGWYPLKSFVKMFNETGLYGVAGNLFNPTHGVELLLRNLLFNTQIKNLLICDITKEDKVNQPGKALYNKLIGEYYEELGKHLNIDVCSCMTDIEYFLSVISKTKMDLTPTREQIIKQPITMENKILPGNIYSQVISQPTIELALPEVVKQIRNHGRLIADIQEYINLNIVITDEGESVAEFMSSVPSDLRLSLGNYLNDFLFGTKSEHSYSYGDRLLEKNQTQNVINKLTEKPLTMAGMMSIWYPEDLIKGNSPCLTQIWVRASVDGKLDMTATFRSNDMFRAWQFNAYALRALQIQIANGLQMTPGVLTTVSFSAHIYQKDFEEIQLFLDRPQPKKEKVFYSTVGNFVITKPYPNRISIQQFCNQGNLIRTKVIEATEVNIYRAMKEIVKENPSIENEHLLYLYRELVKALSSNYQQL
jgi:thymidylate synthase